MYPKLRLKYKPNLISLAGGMEKMPITDPEARATPLAPSDWKQMIAQAEVRGMALWDEGGDPLGWQKTQKPLHLRHVSCFLLRPNRR